MTPQVLIDDSSGYHRCLSLMGWVTPAESSMTPARGEMTPRYSSMTVSDGFDDPGRLIDDSLGGVG
jgi:hypothetical protein